MLFPDRVIVRLYGTTFRGPMAVAPWIKQGEEKKDWASRLLRNAPQVYIDVTILLKRLKAARSGTIPELAGGEHGGRFPRPACRLHRLPPAEMPLPDAERWCSNIVMIYAIGPAACDLDSRMSILALGPHSHDYWQLKSADMSHSWTQTPIVKLADTNKRRYIDWSDWTPSIVQNQRRREETASQIVKFCTLSRSPAHD